MKCNFYTNFWNSKVTLIISFCWLCWPDLIYVCPIQFPSQSFLMFCLKSSMLKGISYFLSPGETHFWSIENIIRKISTLYGKEKMKIKQYLENIATSLNAMGNYINFLNISQWCRCWFNQFKNINHKYVNQCI